LTNFRTISACAQVALLASASASMANEGAALLDEFVRFVDQSPATISVEDRTSSGDTARYSGIRILAADDEIIIDIPFIEAAPSGGSMSITYADKIAITAEMDEELGAQIFTLGSSDPEFLISGEPGSRRHSWSDSLVTLKGGGNGPFAVDIQLEGGRGVNISADGDDMSAEDFRVTYTIDLVDEDSAIGYITGERALSFTMQSGPAVSSMSVLSPNGLMQIESSTASTDAEISMAERQLTYRLSAGATKYDVTPPPFVFPPVSTETAGFGMNLQMAFGDKGDVTPAEFQLDLKELKVSESAWSTIDPSGQIPRDAANLRLDIGTQIEWMSDVTIDGFEGGDPIPRSVSLRELLLSAGGATLSGQGAAEIEMAGPIPSAIGSVQVDLKGGLALLDTLANLGLVPPQQAGLARMMLPSFTVQGPDGDDHLISEIQSRADGAILVNGNRIK